VIRNDWQEWALSARGREAVLASENDVPAGDRTTDYRRSLFIRDLASSWRRRPRRAALVGIGLAVCGLVAAVPIGLNSVASGTPQPTTHGQFASLVAGPKHLRPGAATHFSRGVTSATRSSGTDLRTESELRSRTRPTSRDAPPALSFRARSGSGTAKVAAASRTVEMATNRSLRAKSAVGCHETDASSSTSRHGRAHQDSSRTACSSSAHGGSSDSSSSR
jgi:hypothetical protein